MSLQALELTFPFVRSDVSLKRKLQRHVDVFEWFEVVNLNFAAHHALVFAYVNKAGSLKRPLQFPGG